MRPTPISLAISFLLLPACPSEHFLGDLTLTASEGLDGSGGDSDAPSSGGSGADASTGADASAGDSTTDDAEICPLADEEFAAEVSFTWDGEEPDALSVDCTVESFTPGKVQHLELTCLHPGEVAPRTHGVDVGLPTDAALAVAAGDLVHLDYGFTPDFDHPLAFHAELTRGGALVFLAGAAGSDGPSTCVVEESLLSRFVPWGMSLTHGLCEPTAIDRVDFEIGGESTRLWHQTIGTLPDGTLAFITEALHQQEGGVVICGYDILLVAPAP